MAVYAAISAAVTAHCPLHGLISRSKWAAYICNMAVKVFCRLSGENPTTSKI